MYVLLLMVVWMHVLSVESLDCYSCTHINSTNNCQSMITCQPHENCYTESNDSGNQMFFQLGCRPHSQCLQTVTQSPQAIVGRAVTSQSKCSRCCSLDGCNRDLCAFENQLINEKGPCEDDPDFDCRKIGSALNVCGDVQHAKLICRKYCDLCDIVDGAWTGWGSWSNCDVTCGPGHMTRTRTCTNPAPEHGGLNCVGPSSDSTSCNLRTCPTHGQWSMWAPWEACSVTCGIGLHRRHRNCSNPFPSSDGHYCFGDNLDVQICTEKPCGGWSVWSSWSACSASCGVGLQKRTRTCSSDSNPLSGNSCIGSDESTQICTIFMCRDVQDCLDVLHQRNVHTNGVYNVWSPNDRNMLELYCDMNTDGGGWTPLAFTSDLSDMIASFETVQVISKADKPSYHYRVKVVKRVYKYFKNDSMEVWTFREYEDGFGDVRAEFWMGLKQLYEMTSHSPMELRIDVTAADGTTIYETYQNFSLSPGPDYTLHIGQAAGTAGDNHSNGLTYNKSLPFSAKDKDADTYSGDCAKLYYGGWWYASACTYVNLNADYATPGTLSSHGNGWGGVIYYGFQNTKSFKTTKMMFRRK